MEGKELVLGKEGTMNIMKAEGYARAYPDEVFTVSELSRDVDGVGEILHDLAVTPRAFGQGSRDQTGLGDLEPVETVAVCGAASTRALGHVDHDRSLSVGPLAKRIR